jgi:hypothetical protein
MKHSGFALSAAALLLASRLDAGATLRWQELNRQEGKPVQTTAVAYSGEAGLRVDISGAGQAEPTSLTLLYLSSTRTLHIRDGQKAWLAVTPELLERALASRKGAPETRVTVNPTNTRHSFAGFPCEGYQLRQRGLSSRLVCLANPADLKLDELTLRNFREFSRILAAFMKASGDSAASQGQDAHITFNTYDLPGGFPVREWESRNGEIWMDSQVVEITAGEPPAALFQKPAPAP